MKRGDRVIYLADPLLFGVGVIDRVLKDGRLLVQWDREDLEDPDKSLHLQHNAHDLVVEQDWRPIVDADRALESEPGEGMGC